MSAIVSPDDLISITGYTQRAKQQRWLNENGWVYTVNAMGALIVGRWYADQRLAGKLDSKPRGAFNLESVR